MNYPANLDLLGWKIISLTLFYPFPLNRNSKEKMLFCHIYLPLKFEIFLRVGVYSKLPVCSCIQSEA